MKIMDFPGINVDHWLRMKLSGRTPVSRECSYPQNSKKRKGKDKYLSYINVVTHKITKILEFWNRINSAQEYSSYIILWVYMWDELYKTKIQNGENRRPSLLAVFWRNKIKDCAVKLTAPSSRLHCPPTFLPLALN